MKRNLADDEMTLIAGGLRIVAERCTAAKDVLLMGIIPGSADIFEARAKQASGLADLFEGYPTVTVETA